MQNNEVSPSGLRQIPRNWISREEAALNEGLTFPDFSGGEIPLLVKRLLRARKVITSDDLEQILNPRLAQLRDPYLILGMEKAAERLTDSFQKNERVCIYADFDLDGTSGLALLFEGLRILGFKNLQYYQPLRLSEGYGFHPHVVEDLSQQGVKLIVTVDVGITALEAVQKAKELGVDVIVTDHHQPAKQLPQALAIVNPNQSGDQSGLGYLCGAGVAFYLLRAVQRKLVNDGILKESNLNLKSLLDFLAIATLTDLVPLVGDNRSLVKAGLLQLEKTQRPGLRKLLSALQLEGRPLTGQDVAIRFAPKLNALSRLENGLLPVDLFLVSDEEKAEQMVKSVLSSNEDRVSLQHQGERLATEILSEWPHKDFVFVSSTQFHRGVIGLIATKMAQAFNCPAFVGSENDEGLIVGSSRLPNGEEGSVLLALQAATTVLNRFGGHHSASGFELHKANQQAFIDLLNRHFQTLDERALTIEQEFDFELSQEDVTEKSMKNLDAIGPFGQGFAVPQFVFRNLKVKSVYELRGGHLKISFHRESAVDKSEARTGNFEALYFSPPSQLRKPVAGVLLDVLGELQWNYFAGKQSVQLLVRDLKEAGLS